jgi:glycosyltransferase involved in cell wall biosynthesis
MLMLTHQPLGASVAVLITYHNEGNFLKECLTSLQNNRSWPEEIFIYDDASAVPPEPYIPQGLASRVIKGRKSRGPSHARNVLLDACGCDYVHFQDADDLFAPGWLDEVRASLASARLDAVFTEVASYKNGLITDLGMIHLGDLSADPDLLRFCLSHPIQPLSGTYLRECVQAVDGYSSQYSQAEDYDFHIRLAARGVRYGVNLRPLVWKRAHRDNRSNDIVRVWSDAVRILETHSATLGPQYLQTACDFVAKAGRTLHQAGALQEAEKAFDLARRIGRPAFRGETVAYRIMARLCGPMMAEQLGCIYRSNLPGKVRARLRFTSPE